VAAARTFAANAGSTEGLPFITRETVAGETPARAATSAMVCTLAFDGDDVDIRSQLPRLCV
jgi:hypothetical protein